MWGFVNAGWVCVSVHERVCVSVGSVCIDGYSDYVYLYVCLPVSVSRFCLRLSLCLIICLFVSYAPPPPSPSQARWAALMAKAHPVNPSDSVPSSPSARAASPSPRPLTKPASGTEAAMKMMRAAVLGDGGAHAHSGLDLVKATLRLQKKG